MTQRNRIKIPDLTPPHRHKTVNVHGIGSKSISDARDEQDTLNFITAQIIKSILFSLWTAVDWDSVSLWDIDWEEWIEPVLRSGEATEPFDWNNQNLTNLNTLTTDTGTPRDLTVDCGAEKTIVLTQVVYDDVQFPVSAGRVPASNAPTYETFTTNTRAYAFDIDDYLFLQHNEMPHWWKQGTDGVLHTHFAIKTAQSTGSDRFAKFTVHFAIADVGESWTELGPYTAEATIPTGSGVLLHFRLDMGTVTLTNFLINSQITAKVTRIAATGGTEYADDVYITQVGVHLQKDTMGSRQEKVK